MRIGRMHFLVLFLEAISYGKSTELNPDELDSNPRLPLISYLLVGPWRGQLASQCLNSFTCKVGVETEATQLYRLNQLKYVKALRKVLGRASLVVQWLRICCQCRGHGFKPWSRKIPHAAEQLNPCTTTTEPAL